MVMSQQPPPGPPPAEPSLVQAAQPQRGQGSSVLAAVIIGLIGVAVVAGLVIVVAGGSEVDPPTAAVAPSSVPSGGGATASTAAVATPAGAATAPVSVEGAALADMPDVLLTAEDDPAAGQVAPTLHGTDFAGNPVTIGAEDGRAKVIYFVAHWCPHCQAEVPLVQQLIDSGQKPDNVDIYAVSTAVKPQRGNYPPSTWLDQVGFTPVTMRDDEASSAVLAYGGGGFPFAVYLDSQNRVLARSSGELGLDGIAQMWAVTSANAG